MLAQDILAEGVPVVEVGHPAVLTGVKGVVDMTGSLPIPALVDVIRHARLFMGCDSGPAHIANALRTDSLILLGRYRTWGRYCPWTGHLKDNWDGCVLSLGVPLSQLAYVTVRSRVLDKLTAPSALKP